MTRYHIIVILLLAVWEIQYYEGDAKEKHLVWGQRMLAKAEERLRRQAATTG